MTAAQLQAEVDAWDDEKDLDAQANSRADVVNIVIIPPDNVDYVSDNEDVDENLLIMAETEEHQLPQEVCGQFEVEYGFEDSNEHVNVQVAPERKETEIISSKWSKSRNYSFPNEPVDNSVDYHKKLYDKIGKFSALF